LVVLNLHRLYKTQTHETSHDVITQLQVRIALARTLLEQNLQNNLRGHLVRIGRPSSEPTSTWFVGRHFPSLILPSENKQLPTRRCFVCSHTKNKTNRTRHKSKYECSICDVGLCVDPCFRIYHTILNF
jgi:hypothetical protein